MNPANTVVIEFNEDQKAAINKAANWYRDLQDGKTRKRWFFLSGYAGTGKTTCAKFIANLCCTPSFQKFIAPTGKAASRLRLKGCVGAETLHRFAYHFFGKSNDEDEDSELVFIGKQSPEGAPKLIILDEGSMVGRYDFEHLLSFGIPILVLGDIGQIPPVRAEQYFTEHNCDYVLEKIERNGGNIVSASMYVRQGFRLPSRVYDDVLVTDAKPTQRDVKAHVGEDAVILCSYNETRHRFNTLARAVLNIDGNIPQVGEKLVCMFNQHGYGIMNGEQVVLLGWRELTESERSTDDDGKDMYMAQVKSLTNLTELEVKFNLGSFSRNYDKRQASQKAIGGFDFGYALTIHKSQGSEWDNVMVIEEFLRGVPYQKLMYTAITRAVKHLTIFRAPE